MSSTAASTVHVACPANAFAVTELEVNLNQPGSYNLADKINEWRHQNPDVLVTDVTFMIQGASRIAYITWRKVTPD